MDFLVAIVVVAFSIGLVLGCVIASSAANREKQEADFWRKKYWDLFGTQQRTFLDYLTPYYDASNPPSYYEDRYV